MNLRPGLLLTLLLTVGAGGVLAGVSVGSTGWADLGDDSMSIILWEIRLPRSLGAWWAGALLGMAGAMSQGLFRNPLADPYLLGSASGAGLAVAIALALTGISPQTSSLLAHVGLTGIAFVGTLVGVGLTLVLARGVEQTLRLLLAGVVVGVVLNALTGLATLWAPDILRAMQAFLLGNTGLLGWSSVWVMTVSGVVALFVGLLASPALDALTLGEATAASLGMRMGLMRLLLILAFALATGAAVAQTGIVAFVGLVAPHLVRSLCPMLHGKLILMSAAAGGALLLASPALDALTLGEATAASLGMRMGLMRLLLILAFALATGAAVAQTGIVAFVGLVAPHLVRSLCPMLHGKLILMSAAAGGALLLVADVIARGLMRPQELPVGLVTALLGGVYLLVLMHRRGAPKR